MSHSSLALADFEISSKVHARMGEHEFRTGVSFQQVITTRTTGSQPFLQGSFSSANEMLYDEFVNEVVHIRKQVVAIEQWKKHIVDSSASTDIDALEETVGALFDAMEEFGLEGVRFPAFNPETVNVEHLAVALRATVAWKHEIAGWNKALLVARETLARQNVDPDEVLYGLI